MNKQTKKKRRKESILVEVVSESIVSLIFGVIWNVLTFVPRLIVFLIKSI